MADTKITALTALTGADPANDVIPIVDVSDTTMAASGTTKKISVNNILGASGTATLASATITGDLTVDTSTLKVDSANNRVGVNTASPATDLEVRANGTAEGTIRLYSVIDGSTASPKGSYFSFRSGTTGGGTETARLSSLNRFSNVLGGDFSISTADTSNVLQNRLTIDSGGVFTFAVGGSTAMTLNSTGLGVGTSNFAYKINAAGFIAAVDPSFTGTGGSLIGAMLNNDNTAPGLDLRRWTGTAGTHGTTYIATDATGATFFYNGQQASNTKATSLKMTLDASGNLLVGTTTNTNSSRVFARGTGGATTLAIQSSTGDTANPGLLIGKFDNDSTTSQILVRFTVNNNAAGSGQINANGASQAAFGTFSDSRLKENILSLPSQLANILSLRPVEFDYKDGSGHQIGFVAQEMQEVYSDAVGEQNGFLTVTGWSKTEARLVSAIKELAAKVQALEAKLA